jgi:hypothetical protein
MNHDVPSRRNLRPIAPQNFADASPYAIPHYSATEGFLDADSESARAAWPGSFASGLSVVCSTRLKCILRAEENCKLRARAALTRAIYRFIFDAFQQTRGTRKILPRTVRISRWA